MEKENKKKGQVMNIINKLSVVISVYNEEAVLDKMYQAVVPVVESLPCEYELLFVNDGSRDKTQEELEKVYNLHETNIVIEMFSRNFGKEAAIYAGFQKASGDLVTVIDADLQQRPEIVVKMVKILLENEEYDCVAAYQEERHEGKMVGGLKNMFYKIINKTSEIEFYPGASDFRTFRRTVVDAILSLPEYHRFSKGIFSWVGFNTCYIPYIAEERNAGETKWSVSKLFKYAIEGFISYTTFPLKIATGIGLFTSLCAIIYLFVVVIQKLCFGNPVPGYPTIVVLILLLGGIQLTILGIIGEYLARMYIQGKHRPIYIEKKLLDYKKDDHEEN